MTDQKNMKIKITPERESLGFLLADTTRLIRRVSAQYLDQHNITVAQMRGLLYLARNEGLRQVDLAELLEVQPITLARMIDQLAETGLVERRPDPTDRRAFQLYLTDAAVPIVECIGARMVIFQQQMLQGLTPDQIELLFVGLNKVRDNLADLLV